MLVTQYEYNCAKGDNSEGMAFTVAHLSHNNVSHLHRCGV